MSHALHLERMERELNCPICLSLLNSAVSLNCNHVFCCSCIEKSMKSASNCPVCKVPYIPREIRPAPQMDNLVSVYRSMEIASDVSIFVTQTAVSNKISDKDDQTGAHIHVIQDKNQVQLETSDLEDQGLRLKKRSRRSQLPNEKDFISSLEKPSFPTKKRVRVPFYPAELQRQPEILERGTVENCHDKYLVEKNVPDISETGELVLSPFFWLRDEEDAEKSSQETSEDQITGTPPNAPCFSDIKDSDDEIPSIHSPKIEDHTESKAADFIDSEMFDWTQRPCSPELYSSPLSMQIEDNKCTEPRENADVTSPDATPTPKTCTKKRKCNDRLPGSGKVTRSKGGMCMSHKRIGNSSEIRLGKRSNKSMHEVPAADIEFQEVPEQVVEKKSRNMERSLNAGKVPSKNRNVIHDAPTHEKEVSISLNDIELIEKGNKDACADYTVSEQKLKNRKFKKCSKICETSEKGFDLMPKLSGRIRSQKAKTRKTNMKENQCVNMLVPNAQDNLPPLVKTNVPPKGVTSLTHNESRNNMLKSLKVSFSDGLSKKSCSTDSLYVLQEASRQGQSFKKDHPQIHKFGINASAGRIKTMSTPNRTSLVQCKGHLIKIQCSFCQSSEVSEASGVMVKYQNGKLVTDVQNEKSKIIHVHKNCAEWAPNVYFNGDDVVNLETELSRSRRITCSCCGMKGAALGCYEKNCRKSFHVTCARLTPECRWDHENFVMLCPLHKSSQLPNEETDSQITHKRKVASESPSAVISITDKCKGTNHPWKFDKKPSLCCSALTNAEKGIVSEFSTSSGVTIMKNWNKGVTHVIASTDENQACKRTLKVLMGVIEGKWILNIEWIKACIKAGKFVEEQPYEIRVDIHGIRDGPKLGRFRLLNQQPKLFDGCTFFLTGDFESSYKGYLQDLITSAGGKLLTRKPVVREQPVSTSECPAKTFIIYSLEHPEKSNKSQINSILNSRRGDAEALAASTGSTAASNSWILNSIAGHKLQNLGF